MKRIISSILVFAMLLMMVPAVFASTTNDLHLGGTELSGTVGNEIRVPIYLTGANNTAVTVPSGVTFRLSIPTGLSATIEAGKMPTDGYVTYQASKQRINVFYDGAAFSVNPDEALFTVVLTTETAGDYNLAFSSVDFATLAVNAIDAKLSVTEYVPPVVESNKLHLGAEVFEANVGEVKAVQVYLSGATDIQVPSGVTFRLSVPTGLSAELVAGKMPTDGYATYQASKQRINVFYDGAAFTVKADEPLFTVNFTASAAGEYDLAFSSVDFAGLELETVGAKFNAIAVAQPEPVKSLVVEPAAITVPYAEQGDVAAYIKSKITSATYYVDEVGTDVLTNVVVDENGLVTYEGTTFQIQVTLAPAPVITGVKVSGVDAITVAYGKDASEVIENAMAQAVVTVEYDTVPAATVTDYTYEYDGTNVVISYAGTDKTATIPVTVITAASLKIPADIVVDFGADVAEFIKNNIVVKVVLSDNTEIDPTTEVVVTDNGDNTATVAADGVEATINYTIGADPSALASIEIATEGPVVVPYGAEVAKYIAANIKVSGTTNGGDTVDVAITEANVTAEEGTATIDVNGLTDTIAYEVEVITDIELEKSALDLAWDADVEAAVKAVKVYYVYSANTAKSEVPAEEIEYEIGETEAVVKVGQYSATIALNIAEMPKYEVEEVAPVYALDGHKALVITMNVDGVPYVDGVAAVKVADKKFVYVTDAAQYAIEVKEEEAEIVAWGRLHRDDTTTALDALIALNASAGKIADELKADDNAYIKADVVFDYEITSADALAINNISLNKAVVASVAE